MSGEGTEITASCETVAGGGGGGGGSGGNGSGGNGNKGNKKRDSLGAAGSPAHLIIKDLGEIHSRLLDHKPIIQGEIRYFVKEFEEKRGLRELRVLENWKNMIHETNEHTLPKCRETMQDNLNQVLQRLQAVTDSFCRLQQREQERNQIHNDHLIASENRHVIQWDDFMKEQHIEQAGVDEEHRKAMERLKEQYSEMEKDLAKFSTF